MKITYETMLVTPDMAQTWLLKHNLRNRRLSPPRVEVYSQQMRDELWQETGDTIKFDTEDILIDGQHRLAAIVKSRVSVRLTVVRGLDPNVKDVIDDVRPRTVADQLSIVGKTNCASISSVAKLAMRYDEGILCPSGSAPNMGNATVISFIHDNPDIELSITLGKAIGKDIGYSTAFCFSIWATRRICDHADDFWSKVRDGACLQSNAPALVLRNMVIRRRIMEGRRSSTRTEFIIACCARAWNAYRIGENLKLIKIVDPWQVITFK